MALFITLGVLAILCIPAYCVWRIINWIFELAIRELRREFMFYMATEYNIPYGISATLFNFLMVIIIAIILKIIF